jgi:hypothetical protein
MLPKIHPIKATDGEERKEHFGNCKNANLLPSIKSEKHKEWKKQYIANHSADFQAKKANWRL